MFYQACLNLNNEEVCGADKRQLSFKEQSIKLENIPFGESPVCLYELWDETLGFRKWGP